MTPLLIYLHGMNSSSKSSKAVQVDQYIKANGIDVDTWIPDLPIMPADIVTLLKEQLMRFVNQRDIYIIGSSLGGYLATWAQQWLWDQHHLHRAQTVLINPAVVPEGSMKRFYGMKVEHHSGEELVLNDEYIGQLLKLEVPNILKPETMLVMLQRGDETLDYRLAEKKYADCRLVIEDGGNHSFANFEGYLPYIFNFFQFFSRELNNS